MSKFILTPAIKWLESEYAPRSVGARRYMFEEIDPFDSWPTAHWPANYDHLVEDGLPHSQTFYEVMGKVVGEVQG